MIKNILTILLSVAIITIPAMAMELWEYGTFEERAEMAETVGLVTDKDFYKGSYEQNIALMGYYKNDTDEKFGISIPDIIAWFEDTLQTGITGSSTSLTLVAGTDKEGNDLSGTYGLTVDEGLSSEELMIATCAGTSCTSLTRGVSVTDGKTSVYALINDHRRGADIKITDAPFLMIAQRLLNGDEGFPNEIYYDDTFSSIASSTTLIPKWYADNLVNQGAATSTETVAGISELATQVESASSTPWNANNPHVQQSEHASSTPYSGMTGLWDIWSENDGKMSQDWLDFTNDTWSFTGTKFDIDSGTASGTAMTAITTGSTTPADFFHGHQQSLVYSIDNTANSVTGATETEIASVDYVGGSMGDNSMLKIKFTGAVSDDAGGGQFKVKFGGETIATSTLMQPIGASFFGEVNIFNLGSMNSQISNANIFYGSQNPNLESVQASSTAMTIDTTQDQTFTIENTYNQGGAVTITASTTIMELIK